MALFTSSFDITTFISQVETRIGSKIKLNEISYLEKMSQKSFEKLQKMLINQLSKVLETFITHVKTYEACDEDQKNLFSQAVKNYVKRQGDADLEHCLNKLNKNVEI
jgi:hypothetical protein